MPESSDSVAFVLAMLPMLMQKSVTSFHGLLEERVSNMSERFGAVLAAAAAGAAVLVVEISMDTES